ncbi:MAG: ATP-dependent zinc metalloprotease FtsH [Polyangiaceae bacterium]|nr:ATP-dependent zinc metalloprotease FtsH [Polyangiaceae bacterium]
MAEPSEKKKLVFTIIYGLLSVGLLVAAQAFVTSDTRARDIPYNEFLALLRDDKIDKVELRSNQVIAALKDSEGKTSLGTAKMVATGRLPGIDESPLLKELEEHRVSFEGKVESSSAWRSALLWTLPILLLVAPWVIGLRLMKRTGGAGALSVGRSKSKVYDATQDGRVTFSDVAGVDEAKAELVEIVDYLREPRKYQALGARVPKGVLLVGPPGTGKTLLAKAVAGEAGVPFFALSGSAFIEMFVGVGAARVRDLFEQAKQRAPCIVFIDELDAIGRSRAGAVAVAHEEREQTLNQLLVEMDGFDANAGVLLMAASNRPEVLDPALLRPGRFDRQVVVDRPDVRGREAILLVHARKVALAPEAELSIVARMTPGMVGSDLANVINEAALGAARRSATSVGQQDLVAAVDRMQLGLEKKALVMTPAEKRRIAIHEAGHALVALSTASDPVHRVTIIPRSIGALGATLQLPTDEHRLMTLSELEDRLCVMMGGRVAEELELDEVSTGASNDLERASETARQMVCRFGMSERLGPLAFGRTAPGMRMFDPGAEERNFSERTAETIDDEVRGLVDAQHERARSILKRRRSALKGIAEALLAQETLSREELDSIVSESESRGAPQSVESTANGGIS